VTNTNDQPNTLLDQVIGQIPYSGSSCVPTGSPFAPESGQNTFASFDPDTTAEFHARKFYI